MFCICPVDMFDEWYGLMRVEISIGVITFFNQNISLYSAGGFGRSNDIGFICAGVHNVGCYKRNAWYNFSCLLQNYCHLNTKENCLLADSFWRPMA